MKTNLHHAFNLLIALIAIPIWVFAMYLEFTWRGSYFSQLLFVGIIGFMVADILTLEYTRVFNDDPKHLIAALIDKTSPK